ncbi:hypothetical protein LC085_13795 [Bacillus tianshenii]|uniref:hypothetical protein n=1 Tax=Sutcliffiella tianshenii TaxID=1463404 RepID=UPI001CD52C03|nr:hypothetical protein [Bacillus tianshenii]MCA1320990.1 hypothetical protein [Bacillus tianshenii]
MEYKLKDLRRAMDATTHSGVHFSEEQKNNIRAAINSGGDNHFSKPRRFHVFVMSSVAMVVLTIFLSSQIDLGESFRGGSGQVEHMVNMPEDIPFFVKESDIGLIDWNRTAEPFGGNLVGNEKKSGVIGMDMPSLEGQKWMWHLWGTDANELTVVGFHRETKTVHPLLLNGTDWSTELGGENNGADQHIPSSVKVPERGEWAILLYTDGELFDILVYEF